MTATAWLMVVTVCLLGAMTPGASLVVILRQAARGGLKTGLVAAWAHAGGIAVYAGATVAGVAAWLAEYPASRRLIVLVGALYLGWLGVTALRGAATGGQPIDRTAGSAGSAMRDGFITALVNPKVAGFFLALFSQFVTPGAGLGQQLALAGTAVVIDGAWYSLVAVMATRAVWHRLDERRAAWLDGMSGAVLLAVAGLGLIRVVIGS